MLVQNPLYCWILNQHTNRSTVIGVHINISSFKPTMIKKTLHYGFEVPTDNVEEINTTGSLHKLAVFFRTTRWFLRQTDSVLTNNPAGSLHKQTMLGWATLPVNYLRRPWCFYHHCLFLTGSDLYLAFCYFLIYFIIFVWCFMFAR